MNKKMEWFYTEYQCSKATELYHVYGRYSEAKRRSFENIKAQAAKLDAIEPVRILSNNTYSYTCAYIYPHPEYGHLIFRVETSCHTYEADLDHA